MCFEAEAVFGGRNHQLVELVLGQKLIVILTLELPQSFG